MNYYEPDHDAPKPCRHCGKTREHHGLGTGQCMTTPAPAPEPRMVGYECDQCRHPISKPAWTAFEPTCAYCGGTYRPAVQPSATHTEAKP